MVVLPGVHRRTVVLGFLLGLTVLLSMTLVMPNRVNAQAVAPNLGTAAGFAVLGGTTVTNTGPTTVSVDLGVSPGSAVTGFPPGIVSAPGTIHAADVVAAQAQSDVTTAYNFLAGQALTQDLTGTDLGGLTLTPGVYFFSSSAALTGTLTLDAQGDPGAVFIFQIGSTLTTASSASVVVINGGSACNAWWQVGSSATLGTATTFAGSILALTSITVTTGASIVPGRALARNGAVTLDTNTINSSACFTPAPGLSLTKSDGGATFVPGGGISYTLNYQNTGNVPLTGVTLTDVVPADTTFNAGPSSAWSCANGDPAGTTCTLIVGDLAVGATGSAIFAVTVNNPTGATEISNSATITSGATTDTAGDTTAVATPAPPPPPGATAVPQTFSIPATFVPTPTQSDAVSGLPNTGGGPPQPTYWIVEPGR